MAEPVDETPTLADPAEEPGLLETSEARRRRWPRVLAVVALIFALGIGYLWVTREEIADNIIAGQLQQMGLPATYKIESIGPQRQVLSHIVVGDPARPDLTIERAEVEILPRFGFPRIGEVKLVGARLFGVLKGGRVSFGSLDKALYGGTPTGPFRFPDMNLALVDARALIESEYGPLGAKVEGSGNLRSGFAGTVALNAPRLAGGGCSATGATLYGQISMNSERPSFDGPVRLETLTCAGQGLALQHTEIRTSGTLDQTLDGGSGRLALLTSKVRAGAASLAMIGGKIDATFRSGALTARYDLVGDGFSHPQAGAERIALKGQLRSADSFARIESEGSVTGEGVRPGSGLDGALAGMQKSGAQTLVEPLVAQLRTALTRQATGSRLTGDFIWRQTGAIANLVIPQASLTGSSGAVLAAVSKFQLVSGGTAAPRLAGNFVTGGPGLPQITGRMELAGGGMTVFRIAMAEYRAGTSHLAFPELVVAQGADGSVGFSGRASVSGALPGGSIEGLELPLDGRWEPSRRLFAWRGCRDLKFASLTYASLRLERQGLRLCPLGGGAIVESGPGGTRIAATTPSLALSGKLGTSPLRIVSGPVSLTGAGKLAARGVVVTLGEAKAPSVFKLGELTAALGRTITGTFAATEAQIGAVPLDLSEGSGMWSYAGGKLAISGGQFHVADREQVDRFVPLVARDATLELANNRITALAVLREPKSDREVATATIAHNLDNGTGHADLAVRNLVFDDRLRPDALTYLVNGVIELARGTVTGTGRIDWTAEKVTSTGTFRTDGLDFAAAFGPVTGASGTIEFTDLLGFVTAPHQKLKIKAINPGIEVDDGVLDFELRPGSFLVVHGAKWPFLDGTLELLPTHTSFGVQEVRRYTLRVTGISAARFIEKLELGNLSATGLFDGDLPLLFDENGGRIEGGVLTSRAPGGTLSYVGELTYKDLSAMGNFVFQTLRSLNYKHMRVALDGELQGELVSRVRFDGVTQGTGAKKNLITKQIAKLPIQLNVNFRAPFYALITSLKAMYDPAYVRDPRALGLVDANGKPIAPPAPAPAPILPPPILPPAALPNRPQPDIQPPVSETKP